jgi:hypothetical protein
MCGRVCLGLCKVHADGDCCKAMHACVGECVWACARRMLRVIAARQCMHVWESVFGLVQGTCSL